MLGCAALTFAQQGRGVIFGAVTDPAAAPLADVKVVVKNFATNAVTDAVNGGSGEYTTPAIPIGSYQISVSQPGFRPVVRTGVMLQVNERAEIDVRLEIGAMEQKIEITADAPLIDTTSATIGNVVENKRIAELPLNGRNASRSFSLKPT